jgi:DNA polymerase-3 subunit gamma/tau
MLEVVQELERNGHNLQHFCRELARHFRNLLVAKIAGGETKLIAASAREREVLASVAQGFSEDDLTRYLRLTLELFKDMQTVLQPRLNLEIGLLRLVHAGKMLPIEEALANLGDAPASPTARPVSAPAPRPAAAQPPPRPAGPSPFERDAFRKASPGPAAAPAPKREPEPKASIAVVDDPASADWRARLYDALMQVKAQHTADAVEHSDVQFAGTEVVFTTSRMYGIALKTDPNLPGIAQQLAGRPVKITIKQGEANVSGGLEASAPAPGAGDAEVRERALEHPAVKRFQELYPDAQVRTVRNLKD